MTIVFHSFNAFAMLSKARLFMIAAFWRAPEGFFTWFLERDRRPGMLNIRENRRYAHEVAAKLIEEKKQELKDGTSRKDLLSVLGSSCAPPPPYTA